MRPHPRIRKTVKWGGTVASVLLVALWLSSGFGVLRLYTSPEMNVLTSAGFFHVDFGFGLDLGFFKRFERFEDGKFVLGWMPSRYLGNGFQVYRIPLWLPAALLLALTTLAWRLDTLARRRAKLGACPKCNYSRAGLAPEAVCPECGSPAPSLSSPA